MSCDVARVPTSPVAAVAVLAQSTAHATLARDAASADVVVRRAFRPEQLHVYIIDRRSATTHMHIYNVGVNLVAAAHVRLGIKASTSPSRIRKVSPSRTRISSPSLVA